MLLVALVAAIALLAATAGPAAASGQDVIDDWTANGVIVGDYTPGELIDAKRLFLVQNPAQAAVFGALIDEQIRSELSGIRPPKDPTTTPAPSVPPDDAPVWLALVAAGAGLVGLGGAGSALYRRSRHPG